MKFKFIYPFLILILILSTGLFIYVSQPIELGRKNDFAYALRAENGKIIQLKLTEEGYWREPVKLSEIDPKFISILIAYEDKRYFEHVGIDFAAITRATWQYIRNGRIISGASTLTMQTARLMHRKLSQKTIQAKLHQMLFALRLEYNWNKTQILETYLNLAPYGGNIEGLKAASQAWLQKPPNQLTLSEAALLVSLPQSPERRRPDKYPQKAYLAKAKVIEDVADKLKLSTDKIFELKNEAIPSYLLRPNQLAPHLSHRLINSKPKIKTTINYEWQSRVLQIMDNFTNRYPEPINGAALIVERRTGKVRSYVGSSEYQAKARNGAINYLTSVRSPGSTLKPLIYAKALDRKKIDSNFIFSDQPIQINGYDPTNFSEGYSGKVSLKDALIQSLNIPAVKALQSIGPISFENNIRNLINNPKLSKKYAGLSLALGGFYLTPEDLINLYLEFSDPHNSSQLVFEENQPMKQNPSIVSKPSSDIILSLLTQKRTNGKFATFKTGTSYNRQDAWSVQITENHLVLVWLGTPDNEATKLLTGKKAAYPITQQIVDDLSFKTSPPINLIAKPKNLKNKLVDQCEKLIQFPEADEWIKTDDLGVKISGKLGVDWFLNSEPIIPTNGRIELITPGAQKITAKLFDCIETVNVFVQVNP